MPQCIEAAETNQAHSYERVSDSKATLKELVSSQQTESDIIKCKQ